MMGFLFRFFALIQAIYHRTMSAILPERVRWYFETAFGLSHESRDVADPSVATASPNGDAEMFGRYWPATFAVFAIIGFYAVITWRIFYDYPYMFAQLVIAGCGFLFLVRMGPKLTFPLYFATLFGTGINVPGLPASLNQLLAFSFLSSWILHQFVKQSFPLPGLPQTLKISEHETEKDSGSFFRFLPFVLLALLTIYAVFMNVMMKHPEAPVSFQQIIYLAMGLAVFQTYRTADELTKLFKVLLAISVIITSPGIIEFVFRTDVFPQFSDYVVNSFNLRVNGISKNAIQYAFNATWIIPIALFLHVQSSGKWSRFWTLVILGFLVLCCLITFNRQSPIIIGAMMIVGLTFIRYRYRGTLILALAIVGLLVAPFIVVKIIERFAESGSTGGPDLSFAIRQDKFIVAREILQDHWLFGIGLNNFGTLWYQSRPVGDLTLIHFSPKANLFIDLGYLQILLDTGVVGLTTFLTIIISSAILWFRHYGEARRRNDQLAMNLLALIAMGYTQLLMSLLIQDTFFIPRTYLLFFLFFGILAMLNRRWKMETSVTQRL